MKIVKFEKNRLSGNETIDCYPLEQREIKKILVLSEQKFKELQKEFKLFFKGLNGRISQRSSLLKPKRRQFLEPQEPRKGSAQKFDSEGHPQRFRDYEPTHAISLNTSDWRRWVRVKEWFSQYAQGAQEQIF